MKYSILEGTFANIALMIGDNYIIPFALTLNVTAVQVGLLNSLVGILSPTTQILGSHLMETRSRKSLLVGGVFFQALIWLIFMLLGAFFQWRIGLSILPILLITFYLVYVAFGAIVGPSWFSLLGDIVPEDYRGRYFAKRNVITNAVALVITLVVAWILDYNRQRSAVLQGFMIVFIFALSTRFISAYFLTRHYYPPLILEKKAHVRLWGFVKTLFKENFGLFTLFVAMLNFAQMIAGPFFSVYMLEDLQFSYSTYVMINLANTFISLFMFPIIGQLTDRIGNIRILRFGSFLIPSIPIFWLFFKNPIELALIPQVIGALGWTSFNFAASNFIYDCIPPEKRGYYVAYYNFLIGCGIMLGGLVGSFIINTFSITFMNEYQFLFLLSGIARAIVVIIFIPLIREVRHITSVKHAFHFRNNNVQKWIYGYFIRDHRIYGKSKTPKTIK